MNRSNIPQSVKQILIDILSLDMDVQEMNDELALLGNIPEFDSMAIVSVITALEEEFNIQFEDDELSAEVFESVGSLIAFVANKEFV